MFLNEWREQLVIRLWSLFVFDYLPHTSIHGKYNSRSMSLKIIFTQCTSYLDADGVPLYVYNHLQGGYDATSLISNDCISQI